MKVKQNPKIIHRFIQDQLYVFDDKKMIMHTFNPVASFIWKQAEKATTLEAIAQKVCEEYDVPKKQAMQDVEKFVKQETQKTKLFILVDKE